MFPNLRRALAAPFVPLATVLVVALAAPGCSDDSDDPVGPAPAYSSITITGPDTLLAGQSGVFTAVVLDTAGNVVATPQLTWTSSSTAIATVNNAGGVVGQSEGEVQIRASGGGVDSNLEPLSVIYGRGWIDQSDGVNTLVDLNGVHFATARTGWAVGDQGTILVSTDAGATWSPQLSQSTSYTLNAVHFISTSIGIVVGSAGRILRTVNSGTTWAPVLGVDTDGGRQLNDVFFQDELRGWIVGNGGLILRTDNRGATWTRVLPAVTTSDLERVSFPNNPTGSQAQDPYGRGWIVGANGTILTSSDYGQTWRIVTPFVTSNGLFGVSRRSTGEAVAVGANNAALFTTASGDTALWSLSTPPTPFTNFEAVDWPGTPGSLHPAWAVGKDNLGGDPVIFRSDDGGQSWNPQDLPGTAPLIDNGLRDVFFLDGQRGWAVGTQGIVLHTATGGQ